MTDEVVERLTKVAEDNGPVTKGYCNWRNFVLDLLDALRPGDLLPNDLILRSSECEEEMADYLYRQAAEATREACAEVARQYRPTGVSEVIAAPAQIEAAIRAMDITEITGAGE